MRAVRAFTGIALLLTGLTLLLIGGGIWAGQHLREGQSSAGEHAVLVLPAWLASTSWALLLAGSVLAMAAVSLVRPPREVVYLVSSEDLPEISDRLGVTIAAEGALGPAGRDAVPRSRRSGRTYQSVNGHEEALSWPPPRPQRSTAVPVSAPATALTAAPVPGRTRVLTMG